MKNKRFARIFTALLCAVLVVMVFPITASADTGPKPSVRITFENLGEELCYGTLLSSRESTGPASAWNGNEEDARHNENPNGQYDWQNFGYDVWKAFVDYAENDDFYFLQEAWQVNITKELAWTYYPPEEFKILLYFPESGEYAVSDVYESYAFDSYFTVNMEGATLFAHYNEDLSSDERINAHKSYNYGVEIMALIARIVITIIIEMLIALLFGYREKKQLLLLVGMNSGTQIILNVLLNIIHYNSGRTAFVLCYILFEIIVVIIEAVLLLVFLNKVSVKPKKRWLMIVYVIIANVVSFWSGLCLANWLPGIF